MTNISLGQFPLGYREPFLELEHGFKLNIDPSVMKVVAKIELDEFEMGEIEYSRMYDDWTTPRPARWLIEITNFIVEVSYPRKFYVLISRERLIGKGGSGDPNDYGEMSRFLDSVITEEAAIVQVSEADGAWVAPEFEGEADIETPTIITLTGGPSWKWPTLMYCGRIVRKFKRASPPAQGKVLDEFERANWAGEVEIPGMALNTLDDALAALRRKCNGLSFRRVGGRASWSPTIAEEHQNESTAKYR